MSYHIVDVQGNRAIIGITNTRATFDISLKDPLAPPEILKGLSNSDSCILGLYYGSNFSLCTSPRLQNLDTILSEKTQLRIHVIGNEEVAFKDELGDIVTLKKKQCINNIDIITSLPKAQAHYLGFLIGLDVDMDKIKYTDIDLPYLTLK